MTHNDWITTAKAVEISGYNLVHLRRLLRSGDIQGQKFGHVWQVNKQSLLQYLEKAQSSTDGRWGPQN